MSPATVALIVQFIELAVQYGPELAADAATLINVVKRGDQLSDDECAAIATRLATVNAALQDAIAANQQSRQT